MALVASVAGAKVDGREPAHQDFLLGSGDDQPEREMTTAETVAMLSDLWGGASPREGTDG